MFLFSIEITQRIVQLNDRLVEEAVFVIIIEKATEQGVTFESPRFYVRLAKLCTQDH